MLVSIPNTHTHTHFSWKKTWILKTRIPQVPQDSHFAKSSFSDLKIKTFQRRCPLTNLEKVNKLKGCRRMWKHPSLNIASENWLGDKPFLLGRPDSQCAISQRAGTPVERGLFDWK